MKKKILITGCSSGIGKATTTLLLQEGFSVVGISRKSQDLPFASHVDFHHFSIDLSHLDDLACHVKKIQEAHPKIDGLICNAARGYFGHLEELCPSKIRQIVDLNFTSPVFLSRQFLPLFKKNRCGEIIFIGSEAAQKEQKQNSIYGSTKAAIRSFAKSLREECRSSGVKVHLISPGVVRSSFYDELHFSPALADEAALLPSDIAKIILLILHLEPRVVFDEICLSPLKKELCFSPHAKNGCMIEE